MSTEGWTVDGRMDGWTEGLMDEPITIIPFDLHWGTIQLCTVICQNSNQAMHCHLFEF